MNFFPDLPLLVLAGLLLAVMLVLLRRNRNVRNRAALARRAVLALLLLVIALRPTVGDSTVTAYSSGVDVVIMIDRTASMSAEDYDGTQPRLQGVQGDLTKLITSLAGSRFAVVAFDNDARVALPFTTDAAAAISLADAIGWRGSKDGTGSDISIGVPVAQQLLERSQRTRPKVGRYLIYVGDGEQTTSNPPSSFAPLRPYLDGGLVLGYGTTTGGPMKVAPGSDTYVTQDGKRALSRIDPGNLERIAAQLDVRYLHRTAPGELSLPVHRAVSVATKQREPGGFELYWIVACLAVVVLAVELMERISAVRRAREDLR